MLPTISSVASLRPAQSLQDAPVETQPIRPPAGIDLEPLSPVNTAQPVQERLVALALAGQLSSGRSIANVTDMVGSLLKIERQPDESAANFTERLLDALKALPSSAQAALQKALNQWVRGLAIGMLVQALRNPAGPEATKLAAQLETVGRDREAVQRQITAGYTDLDDIDEFSETFRPVIPPKAANGTGLTYQSPTSRPMLQLPEQVSGDLRALARSALSSGQPMADRGPQEAIRDPDEPVSIEIANKGSDSDIDRDASLRAVSGGRSAMPSTISPALTMAMPSPLLQSDSEAAADSLPNDTKVSASTSTKAEALQTGSPSFTLDESDFDERGYRQILPNANGAADEEAETRPADVKTTANSSGRAVQANDAMLAKRLILEASEVQTMEGAEGESSSHLFLQRIGITTPTAEEDVFDGINKETLTAWQRAASKDHAPVLKSFPPDAISAPSAAEIIPQPAIPLSLTAALLQDESAIAGLAQALVQMRTILKESAVPAHVLYPSDGGPGDDEDALIPAVEAEDEDRHHRRQRDNQQGQSGDRDEPSHRSDAPATLEEDTSTSAESSDFYGRLGGW
ncbi:hypothetical protein MUU53_06955 [Rhizobium lemnae]|uniref:Flagellar hook-length control protein FliK n=1 Tax=Rhizobium lemnae TaxID=1214924 RepID=A0ABV8E6C3_9HYPH|nr:hypothetical protein [Rhizobium lemnae]MCJ8507651.1 hypothetical protein [Rhizobium lemnae]